MSICCVTLNWAIEELPHNMFHQGFSIGWPVLIIKVTLKQNIDSHTCICKLLEVRSQQLTINDLVTIGQLLFSRHYSNQENTDFLCTSQIWTALLTLYLIYTPFYMSETSVDPDQLTHLYYLIWICTGPIWSEIT